MARAKTVDEYIDQHADWRGCLDKLRKELLAAGFDETIKWGAPSYGVDGKNVVGLGAFQQHCALWFHQGVFLSDPDGVLQNAQDDKTKAMRQWRFASERDVKVTRVRVYLREALANQRAGKERAPDRDRAVTVPPELAAAFAARPALKKAFDALTPGRRREYADHVAEAKREATRLARVEKVTPMIEAGVGLHDKYRNC